MKKLIPAFAFAFIAVGAAFHLIPLQAKPSSVLRRTDCFMPAINGVAPES